MEQRGVALRAAFQHLQARRFAAALERAAPWAGDADGALLHGLALAGSGEAEAAAPVLARIARANPGRDHPVQDLLPLLADAGLPHIRAALRLMPDDARLLGALGAALCESGPMAEAVAAFERAAAVQPGRALGWSNLGKALAAEGDFAGAERAFAEASRLAPDNARIAFNRGVMLLKAGRLAEGWAGFGARHGLPGRPPALPGPRLAGLDGVAGRVVLLTHDEGFGDTLQFIRYAALLAARGATVLASMPAALARLIRGTPGIAGVSTGATLPRYDAWCPVLDLPLLFGTTLATVPAPVGYLKAGLLKAGLGTSIAGLPPGRKIGVAWAGAAGAGVDRMRSIDPAALTPLRAVRGATWVSLQHGVAAPGWMADPMPGVADFADTAGVVAQLDLVVSVDTAVAHLAGGMGKPVLLLDRYDNCWRWLSGRADSPWYPGLRILRQGSPGDWDGVIAAAVRTLSESPPPFASLRAAWPG